MYRHECARSIGLLDEISSVVTADDIRGWVCADDPFESPLNELALDVTCLYTGEAGWLPRLDDI